MTKSDLEETIKTVHDQLVQISLRWRIFVQLFDSGQENIDVLNKSGSNVFRLLQMSLIDDVIMSLSKLTDAEKWSGSENASIHNVVKKWRQQLSDDADTTEIDEQLKTVAVYCNNIRQYRNKTLAHADLLYALKVSTLPRITYDEIELTVEALKKILIKIAADACERSLSYGVIDRYGTGVDALLKVLKQGLS